MGWVIFKVGGECFFLFNNFIWGGRLLYIGRGVR